MQEADEEDVKRILLNEGKGKMEDGDGRGKMEEGTMRLMLK